MSTDFFSENGNISDAERGTLPEIPAPAGVFDAYFNRALTPEDIAEEIDALKRTDPGAVPLREKLFSYRFYTRKEAGKAVTSDRFIGFWVTLQFHEKSVGKSKFRLKIARNSLEKELVNQKLRAIFGGQPEERVLYEQLYSAARRLLSTCRTDSTYTTVMFGFGALRGDQLMEKTLADFFDAVCFSRRCGLLSDYPVVGKAAFHAWADEFPGTENEVLSRIVKIVGKQEADSMFKMLISA